MVLYLLIVEKEYIWLLTWGNVPSGTPVGRAFPGNNSHGQIYGTFGVARFGIKCPDLWEGDRNGISFIQIRGLDFPEEVWLSY